MENLLEYKKLLRMESRLRDQLSEPTIDKEELEAQLQDILELKIQLEHESEAVQKFLKEQAANVSTKEPAASQVVIETPKGTTSAKKQTKPQDGKSENEQLLKILCVCVILVLGALFLAIKKTYDDDKKAKEEKAAQQAYYNSPEQIEKRRVTDSIARAEKHKADSIQLAKRKEKLTHSIKVTTCRLSSPNSAGGCDLYFAFTNKSDKTVKYLDFECHMINAVGDIVGCEARGRFSFGGRYTGPLKPGKNSGSRYWDCIIYNSSAKKVILDKIEITYMDGTEFVIHAHEITYVK